jgi:hypothetical protein
VAAGAGEGARAPSSAYEHLCHKPECAQPRWTIYRRSVPVVVSAYCFEHSHVRMLEPPPTEQRPKRAKWTELLEEHGYEVDGSVGSRTFRDEVRRQRVERERVGRALGLLLQGRP